MGFLETRHAKKEQKAYEQKYDQFIHEASEHMLGKRYTRALDCFQQAKVLAQSAHDEVRIKETTDSIRFATEKRYDQLLRVINNPELKLSPSRLALFMWEARDFSIRVGRPQSITEELVKRATAAQTQADTEAAQEWARQNDPAELAKHAELLRQQRANRETDEFATKLYEEQRAAQAKRDRETDEWFAKQEERQWWKQKGYKPPR